MSYDSGRTWTAENFGLRFIQVYALYVDDTMMFAGTYSGVWHRPLSEMIPTSAVSQPQAASREIQSCPNPLSLSTTINFSATERGIAKVTIVNLLGAEVARLFSGELAAGNHSFTWDASGIEPGMYECLVRMKGSAEHLPILLSH